MSEKTKEHNETNFKDYQRKDRKRKEMVYVTLKERENDKLNNENKILYFRVQKNLQK